MNVSKLLTIMFSISIVLMGFDGNDNGAMYRGNLERTGIFQTKSVEKISALKWEFEAEKLISNSPVVADGIVYFGSLDKNLYAIDINTRLEKWKYKTENPISSSPVVADGVVYFGSSKYLYAVE